MQKKKIAIFTISLMKGGAEKNVALLLNELQDEYDIHLILLRNSIEFDLPHDKIRIHFIDDEKLVTSKQFKKILMLPIAAKRVKKILVDNDISLLISFLNRPNFISGIVKMLGWKGKSIISERIYTSNEYHSNSTQHWLGRLLVKKLYRYADLVLPNSIATAENLRRDFRLPNRIVTVYNAIDIVETKRLADEKISHNKPGVYTFITVGRLSRQKNQLMILEAVKLLPSHDFQVLVIGRGELESFLKEKAKREGLSDKIKFMGYVSNPLPYISQADCFLLSSAFEGFPNVLLEALACGKPVISTDCLSGPREILADTFDGHVNLKEVEEAKFGLLVPVTSPKMFASAMQQMMESRELAANYAATAKSRAADFDVPVILAQLRTLLSEVLK